MTPGDCVIAYRIRLRGQLHPRWLTSYDGIQIDVLDDDQTLIVGSFDQSALFGILNRIRDLGMDLLEVRQNENPRIKDLP